MGTTAQKLTYTANAINGIKNALEERGIVVGNTPLGNYASLIESISTDGTTSFAEKTITEVTARMIEGITQIGDYAFYNQADLTTIEIPSTVTSIGDYAFYGCTSLTTIYFPGTDSQWNSITKGTNWDGNTGDYVVLCGSQGLSYSSNGDGTCKVTGIGTCTDTDLVISDKSSNGDTVTSIGEMAFYNCSGLTSVVIPDSITTIGKNAFKKCYALRSFSFGNATVTSVGTYTFEYSGLTSIEIPATLTTIPIGFCFNCSSLSTVVIPSGVQYIGDQAFQGCNLQRVVLPDSVVSLTGSYQFLNNANLVSVEIGTGITNIGASAFSHTEDRPNFQYITVKATTPPSLANTGVFKNTGNCPIYVPSGSVETYKATTNWSEYASRIQAIPS